MIIYNFADYTQVSLNWQTLIRFFYSSKLLKHIEILVQLVSPFINVFEKNILVKFKKEIKNKTSKQITGFFKYF